MTLTEAKAVDAAATAAYEAARQTMWDAARQLNDARVALLAFAVGDVVYTEKKKENRYRVQRVDMYNDTNGGVYGYKLLKDGVTFHSNAAYVGMAHEIIIDADLS